jgi:hypothetical protein
LRIELACRQAGIADFKKSNNFARGSAGIAQLVEHNLAKVRVAGSSPVSRSNKMPLFGFAQSGVFIFLFKLQHKIVLTLKPVI